MNYINLLELEIKINDCLCTIKQSLEHVCYYLMNDDCNLEKEDIIFELSDADDYISYVNKLITMLEEEYEHRIGHQHE